MAQAGLLRQTIASFSGATRQRGARYLAEGRVVDLRWDNTVALAAVIGGEEYEVSWTWLDDGWECECSCPIGYDCKHAFAAARALLASAAPVAAPAPLPRPSRAAPQAREPDLAIMLAANRDSWRRREVVWKLFARSQLPGLSAYDPEIEELLVEPDAQLLCWRLAQLVAERTGGPLPAGLEPYRARADLGQRYALREQQALVGDLLEWARIRQTVAPRSLRFVWEVAATRAGMATLRGTGRVTSHRLQDQPRSFEQLRQLLAEAQRTPGTLAPPQEGLLTAFLDGCTRSGSWGEVVHASVAVAMLKTVDDPGPLMSWTTDLSAEVCARGGIAPGAPLRLGHERLRLLPAAGDTSDGARLGLACVWPDGSQRWIHEVVYLPSAEHPRALGAVIADGGLFVVAEEPPPLVRDRFLAHGGIDLPRAHCAALLGPLAQRFPQIRAALAAHTRPFDGTPVIALDLRDDDWLQLRVFLYSGAGDWLPGDEAAAGATVHELTPGERWERWQRPAQSDANAFGAISEAGTAAAPVAATPPAAAPAATPALEVWLEAPDPEIVGPALAWLAATGADPGTKGRPGGSAPSAPDRDVGWWMQASARRMAALAEAWDGRPPGVRFVGTERIRRLLSGTHVVRPTVRVTASGLDWFAIAADWEAEGLALTDADLARLRAATTRFVRLPGGWVRRDAVSAHDASAAVLADLGVEVGGGEQRITLWQLAGARAESLAALESMTSGRAALQALATLRQRLDAFTGVPEVPVPASITAALRPYQRQGLSFLAYASHLGIGAVLADDMGLGKTLQALAWLQHLIDHDPAGGPSLVVCPTSVMHNWAREAAQFAPALRVLVLERGAQRHQLRKSLPQHDLLITNYALLRRDIAQWKVGELRALILDEAQHIKNPDAAVSRAACELRAGHRLALTGTPLENRPLDLWSIASFATPGYLGTRADFSARFDRLDAPPHARALLAAKLRPMLLRRLKREVAADLPERIEERRDCELTAGQRQLYLAELRRSRRLIEQLGADPGALRKNKITILAALTRLRQICCHPALARGRAALGSGKFDALFELLEPLLAEGHKVLLFSQFVQCLQLLEREMARREVAHHMLTGRTVRRDAVVRAFQGDERPGVFLISLKAGGTGLNLTAASYVVLFDPWWNPAVEAQAIDRTHRIGQDRTVIAYRLIARGTIEEKIWELQQRKAAMARDILGEEGFARALDRADLEFLLQEV
ncbi:MAG TPA: DEAD/DEAH box helicase [Candidatus Dormibacteraeota bacterium]|nr:DEAD/DEAH box helicase [Candidatus Dormibacteraeota bacterium]